MSFPTAGIGYVWLVSESAAIRMWQFLDGNSVPGMIRVGIGGLVAAHHRDIFISFAHHHHHHHHHHHYSVLIEGGRSLLSSMTLDEEVGEELRFTEAGWRSPDIICTATITGAGKCTFFFFFLIEQSTQDEVILPHVLYTED